MHICVGILINVQQRLHTAVCKCLKVSVRCMDMGVCIGKDMCLSRIYVCTCVHVGMCLSTHVYVFMPMYGMGKSLAAYDW